MIKKDVNKELDINYKILMKENNDNPLGLEKKLYTVKEFGATLRNKFGADNYVSNTMLAEIFLAK